jgi:hypothetical protein
VSVLAHGGRTAEIADEGLRARDVLADLVTASPVAIVEHADEDTFDLVLVALRRETLQSAAGQIAKLSASPLVLFFGNNPGGRAALPADVPGPAALGFPGVGDLAFAAHCRHAEPEMRALANDVLARLPRDEGRGALRQLLTVPQ